MASVQPHTSSQAVDFRALLVKLREAYNDFDLTASAECRGALRAEESRESQSSCKVDGGARTSLAASGMQRKAAQHKRVIDCLLLHFGVDAAVSTSGSESRPGCSNWLGELHEKLVASVPPALLRLYCDESPTMAEAQVLELFTAPGAPSTRPHRERGSIASILGPLSKLVIIPLQQTVSFAIPNEPALAAIAAHAPLVEVGAGTGYWSAVLQHRGVDCVAYDAEPPTAQFNNAFFMTTYTGVARGDGASLFRAGAPGDMSGRTMLVTWPNNPDALDNPHLLTAAASPTTAAPTDGGARSGPSQPVWDADCLQRYMDAGGRTVCYVGERETQVTRTRGARAADCGASSSRRFQAMLAEHFSLAARHALPGWPYNVDDLTIWTRHTARAQVAPELP